MRTRPGRGQAGPPRCSYLTRAQVRTGNGGCGLAVTDSDRGGAGPRVGEARAPPPRPRALVRERAAKFRAGSG
ncbi:unnamed protein product [Rangifer tarandus platyrhynchus]|uniref:Uncharacterized protein n=2 Tax=Rangifer tarandus platyrhynchus TaxID=3082113 RepID=A0ABN8XW15_RANTA|nr:unnamed protein product [Rangifer tarandus platyrhynchus]CAI9691704.1 unnamed protein product [Rangifer tarandus platyrhynchus]